MFDSDVWHPTAGRFLQGSTQKSKAKGRKKERQIGMDVRVWIAPPPCQSESLCMEG